MKIDKFLRSRAGRRFYNFAYCWGACLVILGAVFKIAHMPFDSVLLMIGLFTEVFIFFISGFDLPPEEYEWEKVFPELRKGGEKGKDFHDDLEEARRLYAQGAKETLARMTELGRACDEHIARLRDASDAISPETMKRLSDETAQMAELLRELNAKYSGILEVMNATHKK